MADVERKLRMRHTHEPHNLTYGHFGTAKFLEAEGKWHFLRSSNGGAEHQGTEVLFRLLSQRQLAEKVEKSGFVKEDQTLTVSSARRQLLRQYPDLAFVDDSLLREGWNKREDQAQQLAYRNSSRLIYGLIHPEDTLQRPRLDRPGIPVLGFLDKGEVVFHSIDARRTETSDDDEITTELDVPSLASASSMLSSPESGPVLQLIFQQNGHLLATRHPSAAVIWTVHRNDLVRDATSMNLKSLLTIPISRTGGHPHVHITFHPANPHKLGIIDTHGNWSVWSIHGKRSVSSRLSFRAQLEFSGKMFAWAHQPAPAGADPYFDGWHRMHWLVDEYMGREVILIYDRQYAEVLDRNGDLLYQFDLRLGPRSRGNCLLQVEQSKACPSICYILTTQRIMVVSIDGLGASPEDGSFCSWDHFRGHGDLGLKMNVLEVNDAVYIFVHSTSNKHITMYNFVLRTNGEINITSATDPTPFILPDSVLHSESHLMELAFQAFHVRHYRDAEHEQQILPQVHMLILLQDEMLHEVVYELNIPSAGPKARRQTSSIWPLDSKKPLPKSSQYVDEEDEEVELDDFIVDDEFIESGRTTISGLAEPYPKLSHEEYSPVQYKEWSSLLTTLQSPQAEYGVEQALSAVNTASENIRALPPKLLAELLPRTRISDVEEDSEAIVAWTENFSVATGATGSTSVVPAKGSHAPSMLDVYHELLDQHVGPLSLELPDRIRVQSERLARSVALDVTASSYRFSHQEAPIAQDAVPSLSGLAIDDIVSQPALLSYLRKYTPLSKNLPPALNAQVTKDILAHLHADPSDPAEYDYREIERELAAARRETETENMDVRDRRRAEKLALFQQRKLEHQRRQKELAEQQKRAVPTVQSSQAIGGLDLRSSPETQQQAMTQPEAGAFGGRDIVKERTKQKKKKRVGGF